MKRLVFLWLVSLLGSIGAYSQEDASYPWQVKGDSLLLFEGTTYRYTVDTPEDSGLVSTLIKVEDLKKQLKENGLGRFSLFSSNGREKMHGYPETGDYLLAASPGKRFAVFFQKVSETTLSFWYRDTEQFVYSLCKVCFVGGI